MIRLATYAPREQPALTRLAALAPLDAEASVAVATAIDHAATMRPRAELAVEGRRIAGPRLIVSGWAARTKIMPDGRRQFLSFLLPGDLIGMCRQPRPIATSTIVALTPVATCAAPPADVSPWLAEAYAMSAALEEAYLLAHIVRLGRMHAQERIADLLLELLERLTLNGMASGGQFEMPLTQEMLGDALGLTSVHINRMLQAARREGDIVWRERQVELVDPEKLAERMGRRPMLVSAAA